MTDATGLQARYDYAVSFMMEPGGRAAGPDASADSQPDTSANLIDALREQLGLRLEKSKADRRTFWWWITRRRTRPIIEDT